MEKRGIREGLTERVKETYESTKSAEGIGRNIWTEKGMPTAFANINRGH